MFNGISNPEQNQSPSFEEFKETILQQGADADFVNRVTNLYGRIPRWLRILHNIDPTGLSSAFDQLFNEEVTEREQDNILRAIYYLAIRIAKVETRALPSLPDDKFKFLYFVYIKSETDMFSRVKADDIQHIMGLTQQRTISLGQYLEQNGLIEFNTWVGGIKIVHKGIVRVEGDLLRNNRLPEYVSENEIKKIEERIQLRFALLQHLHEETEGDTFKNILHAGLARKLGLEHRRIITQILPYMAGEGWIKCRTNDSVTITEEGIDRVMNLEKINMTSILDTFRSLLEEFDVIEETYHFFSQDGDWEQGESAAISQLYRWTQAVDAALEIAGRDNELRIWRNATRDVQNTQIGTVHSAARIKKALFLQIMTKLDDETPQKKYDDMRAGE